VRRTIFRSTFLLGVLVLLLCATLFFALQYRQIMDETYLALKQEAVYAENGLRLSGQHYLETLGEINRITWITSDGEVLYDSEFSLPIPNQLHCAEVAAAAASGEGQGIRRSESSGSETMYYARLCDDGTILRLSRPMSAVRYALVSVSPILWVLVLVLMISALLSFRTARQIVRPINELDLDNLDVVPYPELTPLLRRIREQKETILEQSTEQERLRREFSANVSHELKTPLTSISGFAELMVKGDVPPDMVKEFSSDIYRESQRMITLVDDIIRLSRLDEGELDFQREDVDLYELASDTLDSLRSAAEQRDVRVELRGEPAVVSGVWQLLSEAVFNLCENAIKYNRPGGSVIVEVGKGADGEAVFSVTDTGIGIPEEHQDRVFERFYRVDKSHSKAIGGTGLGLSIVKHVAQFHHADLKLESSPDAGTRITMIFP
jgi:two-component system phosphate regulon sensor histidine kinase PhoR